jgi:hypothetical protein
MTSNDWIAISSIVAGVFIAVVGMGFSYAAERGRRKREDEQRQMRREDAPHIELAIDCRTLGQERGYYLIEFILAVSNRGLVRWSFDSILLRVRGIEKNHQLVYWPQREPRLEFPVKIINDAEVIPESVNFLFVEPGVQQTITYTTKLSTQIRYIVVHVEFSYNKRTPHTSERVFRLPASDEPT